MGRTAVNVAGQAVVTYIVAHREGLVTGEDLHDPSLVPAE
jgi:Na+/H+-dicarboxylate symporter